nr:MAG TPA: hypothetical protein [Caudoviricetes sp.]
MRSSYLSIVVPPCIIVLQIHYSARQLFCQYIPRHFLY